MLKEFFQDESQLGLDLKSRVDSFNLKLFLNENWKVFVFLVFLVCLVYANSLNNSFVSDDIPAILQNNEINKLDTIFRQPTAVVRPLFYFVVNKIFGPNPVFFRLINISFHIGMVWAAYILVSLLINSRVAFFAVSILTVHPLQTEAVTWISGGPYSQYSFFFIVAFLTYILSAKSKWLILFSILSFILSLESNSMQAIVFPFILLIFVFSSGDVRKKWKGLMPFFILSLIWAGVYLSAIGQRISILESAYYQKPQIHNPLIQIPIAITSYLELIFWPKDLTLYHSEMLFSLKEYFVRLAFFIVLLGLIVLSYRRNRQIFFWLSFFVVSLLPTLLPFGIAWIVAERYVYLGALGIFVVITIVFSRIGEFRRIKPATYVIFSLIIISLCVRTIIRNIDWKNEDNLWIATAQTSPSSPNTHNNMGDVYCRHGNFEAAIEEFKMALEIKPDYADAYHNLAHTYQNVGLIEEAKQNYQMAIKFNRKLWQSYQNLAAIYFQEEKFNLAKDILMEAIEIVPSNPGLHYNLGVVHFVMDEKAMAKDEFQKALDLSPNNEAAKQGLRLISQS